MQPDFWHDRWREGQIGFHQERVTPLLQACWGDIGASPGSLVFVPLCGKSLDMPWLVAQGHQVLGVELSQLAIDQFFDGQALVPEVFESPLGRHHRAAGIEIIRGDVFDLDAAALSGCSAFFDRAALIALPADLRERYAREVYRALPSACRGLLVTLDYPQHEKHGPPFSVAADEVHALHGATWQIDTLQRRDILATQPTFLAEGVTALHTSAYRMIRN